MLTQMLAKVFGTKHEREMKKIWPLVDKIRALEPSLTDITNDELKAKTPYFKNRIANGESLDALLPEAFAVCREAARRVLGMRHYDVQMIGGYSLHRGNISEMKTGEGKTLVATLPVYLNALEGRGVHVVTVNDYLAKRDTEWMGQIYHFLGLTTGTIVHDLSDQERKLAYGADITYGTNNEFGFDYLRDNMKFSIEDMVQRELNYAIVDECDSILIDEARTPLIISGPKDDFTDKYVQINKIIPHLIKETHFVMEEKSRTASLTEEGNRKAEELLDIENLYDPAHIDTLHHIYQALKAHHLYHLDVDYMIKDDEIVIVDEFTGRLMPGRRWSDGLHQAIEAKEGVKVKNENQTLATITFQNYFRMYRKLAGMTGTADTEAVEFKKIYNLDVQVIPTNRKVTRVDENDVIYKTERAKFKAIVTEIQEKTKKGQPVLVGTISIDKSEKLSRALKNEGVNHNVLNAKHHEREAEIIAQAGRKGAVTIATNMAGRGTDILLGGNPEFLAKTQIREETSPEQAEEILTRFKAQCDAEKKQVVEAGGLFIIGTERHESRRIDNQLRGRAGRQGDPGGSRFYLSLEDNLMRIFNGERIQKIMNMLDLPEEEPIIANMVTRAIEGSQRKVEGHNFDVRKHLLDYDDVMNKQRVVIYNMRKDILRGHEIERTILDMLGEVTSSVLDSYANDQARKDDWNLQGLELALQQQFGLRLGLQDKPIATAEEITELVSREVKDRYDRQKASMGELFDQVSRMILLQTIDTRWKEHLERIDRVKEGINLRAYAQKDPLIEYKKEAFSMFEEMNQSIRSETIEKLLKVQLMAGENVPQMAPRRLNESKLNYAGADESVPELGFFQSAAPEAPPSQEYSFSGPRDQGPKMNRAERRRLERNSKKKKN